MPCRANPRGRVKWMYIKSSKSPQFVLFNGNSVEPDYAGRVTVRAYQPAGYYNLTFKNVQLNESGWYICMEVSSSTLMQTIQLSVLGE